MIQPEILPHVLKALQRLIVHAKTRAYEGETETVAAFLNDCELIPEMVADEADRTDEAVETIRDIVKTHPHCRYVVDEFNQAVALACH